jgi:crossover junction endodeoxyribonuclease RuvC
MTDDIERVPVTCIAVGLDLSLSSTGFCLKAGSRMQLETIRTVPKNFDNDLDRLKHICAELMQRIPQDVTMVCVEDFFTPGNKAQIGAAIKLAMLGTVVRMAMYDRGISFYTVAPSQLKKFCTGKGNCPKSIIIREVYKRYGVDCKDDNQADALVLANLAKVIAGISNVDVPADEGVPMFQVEVAQKIIDERPHYNLKEKVDAT